MLAAEGVPFRMKENAFVSVADPNALQTAADRIDPWHIQKRLDYWTFMLRQIEAIAFRKLKQSDAARRLVSFLEQPSPATQVPAGPAKGHNAAPCQQTP
jgi:hypothetical protein